MINNKSYSDEEEELAFWLSAALEDPTVCEEFKQVIEDWFRLKLRQADDLK